MSAWVKWKIAAGGLILAVFFAGSGFGAAINGIMRTKYGSLIDMAQSMFTVWNRLLRAHSSTGLEVSDATIALLAACGLCLWILMKRVRAFEVVK